jgi:glycosyltransferase involved in cell wall biosynthesis
MKIFSAPGRNSGNPYIDLFYDALAPHGIELVGQLQFEKQWFVDHLSEFDAIHLHWPENLWRYYTNPTLKKLQLSDIRGTWRLSKFIESSFPKHFAKESLQWVEDVLVYLKKHNKKIIWTWHNYEPHEKSNEQDNKGQQILAQYADLIIFHSEYAEKKCRENYNIQGEIIIMPHGNYDGIYPESHDRDEIIAELGLVPDIPIVGMLGNIREYKGVDIAIDACACLGGQVQFLCAGNPHPDFDWEAIAQRSKDLRSCALVPRFISDQEFADFAHVSDVLLLPYRSVTGSGALLAALTLGRGVVASDLPFFREVLGEGGAGRLVKPGDAMLLAEGICDYLKESKNIREASAYALAQKYKWSNVVRPVAKMLLS